MTTIAFRDGVMASDSRYSDGLGITRGPKLFRKVVKRGRRTREHLLGICGDVYAAMLFVEWYGTDDKDAHKILTEMADDSFEVLIWDGKTLRASNRYCRPLEIAEPYFAVGSGSRHAITAMDCGKNAATAVQMAMKRDHFSGGKIVTMKL